MGTSIKDHLAAQQDKLIGRSWSCDGNETRTLEPRSSYKSNGSESHLKDVNCAVQAVVRVISSSTMLVYIIVFSLFFNAFSVKGCYC